MTTGFLEDTDCNDRGPAGGATPDMQLLMAVGIVDGAIFRGFVEGPDTGRATDLGSTGTGGKEVTCALVRSTIDVGPRESTPDVTGILGGADFV